MLTTYELLCMILGPNDQTVTRYAKIGGDFDFCFWEWPRKGFNETN